MENFAAIAGEFRAAEAVIEIDAPEELAAAIGRSLMILRGAPNSAAAPQILPAKRGVTARAVREIIAAQDRAVPYWNLRGVRKTMAAGSRCCGSGGAP